MKAAAILLAAGVAFATQAAYAAGPFSPFAGAWRGAGVLDANGQQEPLRCRSDNAPSQGGSALSLSLVCASDSFRIDIHADLTSDGRDVEGSWTEATQNVSGSVSGAVAGKQIDASVSGPGFDAKIAIRAAGKTLNVSLTSPQGRVQVALRR